MSLAEIGSLGGKIWGNLTDDEKYTYKSRYQDELKEYRIKMRNYKSSDNFLGVRTPMPTQYSGNVLEIDEDEGFWWCLFVLFQKLSIFQCEEGIKNYFTEKYVRLINLNCFNF